MKLTRWDTKETIYESEHTTKKECVEDSIKKGVSLYRIDLRGADMTGANMASADLTGANMASADLRDANMTGANMAGANMTGAEMRGAEMRHANMAGANMRGAEMRGAEMRHADLRDADLDFSSWPLWCGSCRVKLDKENNERFAYHAMINMDEDVLTEFLQNPVEFANRFAERKGISKIKAGEK